MKFFLNYLKITLFFFFLIATFAGIVFANAEEEDDLLGQTSLRAVIQIADELDRLHPELSSGEENLASAVDAVFSVRKEAAVEATALGRQLENVLDDFKGNLIDVDSFSDEDLPIDENKIIKVFILDDGAACDDPDIVYVSKISMGDTSECSSSGHGATVSRLFVDTAKQLHIDNHIELYSIRTFNEEGYAVWENEAIRYAVDNGADVINLSTGFYLLQDEEGNFLLNQDEEGNFIPDTYSESFLGAEALDYAHGKGVTIVTAAGNTSGLLRDYGKFHPASISVGALDKDGKPAHWRFALIGTSGLIFGESASFFANGDGYDIVESTGEIEGGTSFASPRVAAVVAQVKLKPTNSFYDINQNGRWDTPEVEFYIRVNLNRSEYAPLQLKDGINVGEEYWGTKSDLVDQIQLLAFDGFRDPSTEDVLALRELLDGFFIKLWEVIGDRVGQTEELQTLKEGAKERVAAVGFFDFSPLRDLLSYLFPFFDERPADDLYVIQNSRPTSFYGFIIQGFNYLQKPFNERARKREFSGATGLYTIQYVDSLIDESLEKIYGADRVLLDSILRLGVSDVSLRSNARVETLFTAMTETEAALQNDIFAAIARFEEDVTTEEADDIAAESRKEIIPEKSQATEDVSKQGRPAIYFTAVPHGSGEVMLKWETSGARICTGYNFETGGKTDGEVVVSLPKETTTYALTCLAGNGNSAHYSINVSSTQQGSLNSTTPPTFAPSALAPTIELKSLSDFTGRNTTLSWESENTAVCIGANFDTGGKTSGSVQVTQTENTEYKITCVGSGGSQTRAVAVEVLKEAELPKNPTITLSQKSGNIILTWSAPSANCAIRGTDGFEYKTEATSGSVNAGPLKSGINYTIECQVERQ
ncbi:MAG: S8 family serine peptidase [Parcubacteria group bacterium]|nr:S8 family serine peptidase [Parcubacteria group bacterium]